MRKKTSSTEGCKSTSSNEVFDGINTSKNKRENLLKAQSLILESKEELQKELREFLTSKGRLLDKAEKLSKTITSKVLSSFSPKKTLDLLFWIHEVKFIGDSLEEARIRANIRLSAHTIKRRMLIPLIKDLND